MLLSIDLLQPKYAIIVLAVWLLVRLARVIHTVFVIRRAKKEHKSVAESLCDIAGIQKEK